MNLKEIFVSPYTQRRLCLGPLGTELDGFCQWLVSQGFSQYTIRSHITGVSHFSRYLQQSGVTDCRNFNSEHVKAFINEYLPQSQCRRPGSFQNNSVAYSINRFSQYFKFCGYVGIGHFDSGSRFRNPEYESLLDEYLQWMKNYHNTAAATLKLRSKYLTQFLDWLDTDTDSHSPLKKLSSLSNDEIQTFFLDYCKERGYASRRSMQATLRTFFRFCLARGYVKQEFDNAVPTLRTYKLSKIPRGIEDKEAQQVLNSINRSTDNGKRDYAIIQMLYTYGIRGGQVRALRLADIDWEQSKILFCAQKNGKDCLLPLTEDVGNSLLDYLQNSRPEVLHQEVFITLRAPYSPLRTTTVLSELIARRLRAAGIKSPSFGSHAFRHCFASRMLENGHSLKFIADMIGHRCLQTTFIYTKVDFKNLKDVALEWPEKEKGQ